MSWVFKFKPKTSPFQFIMSTYCLFLRMCIIRHGFCINTSYYQSGLILNEAAIKNFMAKQFHSDKCWNRQSFLHHKNRRKVIVANFHLIFVLSESLGGKCEERLIKKLFFDPGHNRYVRPVLRGRQALEVKFGLSLQQIVDVVT